MITYILFNTLIYWSIAFILSACFAYAKYLNVTLGGFMILSTYTLSVLIKDWWSWTYISVFIWIIVIYRATNYVVVHYFHNERQRDLFGLIFTLGGSIFLENITNLIYGASPVSFQRSHITWWQIAIILIVLNIMIIYVFKMTYMGKIRRWIYANTGSVRALGVRTNRMIQNLLMIMLPGLVALGAIIANEWAMKASDNLFYIIKGVGIVIMGGLEKREYIFLGDLLYVIRE